MKKWLYGIDFELFILFIPIFIVIAFFLAGCSIYKNGTKMLDSYINESKEQENLSSIEKSNSLNAFNALDTCTIKLVDYETTKEYVEISIKGYSDWDKLDNCYMMKADMDSLIANCSANPIFIAFGTEDSDKLFVYGCKPEGTDADNMVEKSLLSSEDITLRFKDSKLEWNSKQVKCPATDIFKLNIVKDKNKQIIGLKAISMNGNEIHW